MVRVERYPHPLASPARSDMQAAATSQGREDAKTIVMDGDGPMGNAVLRAMSDGFSSKILESVIPQGRSVEDICEVEGIPLSTAYRRVHGLLGDGLLIVERAMVTGTGKKFLIYRAVFSNLKVEFQTKGCRVEGTPNAGVPDVMYRLWRFSRKQAEAAATARA